MKNAEFTKLKKPKLSLRKALLVAGVTLVPMGDANAADGSITKASQDEYIIARANAETISISQESDLWRAMKSFGFSTPQEFADAYNVTFSFQGRPQKSKDILNRGAGTVAEKRLDTIDEFITKDGTPRLANFAFALKIWGTYQQGKEAAHAKVKTAEPAQPSTPAIRSEADAEAATAADYRRARNHVNETPHTYGYPELEYYLSAFKEVIDIGGLNTENSDGRLAEERIILDVLAQLGFEGLNASKKFAAAYNVKFASARGDAAEQQLTDNAKYVGEMLQGRYDIKIGNKEFRNFRLAVEIYVTHKLLKQPIGDTLELAGTSIKVDEINKVLPGLDLREMLFYPGEAKRLATLVDHLPKTAPSFEKGKLTFSKVIKILKMYTYLSMEMESDFQGDNKLFAYNLLVMFDQSSEQHFRTPLNTFFPTTPHGAVASEIFNFFAGQDEYEGQFKKNNDFAYRHSTEDSYNRHGFTTSGYLHEGP